MTFVRRGEGKLLKSGCLVGSLNTFGKEPLIECIPEARRRIRPFFSAGPERRRISRGPSQSDRALEI